MKKSINYLVIAIVTIAVFFTSHAKAQTTDKGTWRLGFGLESGVETENNVEKISNLELGGTVRLQYGLSKKIALTLTSGYYNFLGNTIPGEDIKFQSLGIIPVKIGAKVFFIHHLYFGAEVGEGFETKAYGIAQNQDEVDYGKKTKFIYSPSIGWANNSWDIGLRYESFTGDDYGYGLVALRLAYGFKL